MSRYQSWNAFRIASAADGESPETFWGGYCGACVVGVFVGDLGSAAVEGPAFELIA
ncbi:MULTISPECIES: hypothetical protein [unclassified Streptomyces]|uniref:hypothetical protein n=1 Tax=unclassified Streptomyces TaxID=2593676 RepID=UPI0029A2E6F5|nr:MULTISPECIES: hypothetical protein [unclassified Streptomyces]MDX3772346.1 hypothetical protein [Streptomyces sp. AK08-01B]MDX3821844.1 hypothetical protein [Streptomyces sp. AK08-01A]